MLPKAASRHDWLSLLVDYIIIGMKRGEGERGGEKEKLDFYVRSKIEYERAKKPMIYEFSFSQQSRYKKFRILLGKFVEILKDGMRDEHRFEEGSGDNYWNQLERHFSSREEMRFISEKVYDVAERKIRIFFALLIHTHQIFTVLQAILRDLPHLYLDITQKRANFEAQLAPLAFLRDGKAEVDSTYVKDYTTWLEQIRMQEIEVKNTIEKLLYDMITSIQLQQARRQEMEKKEKKEKEQQLIRKQIEKKQMELLGGHLRYPRVIPREPESKPLPVLPKNNVETPIEALTAKPRHLKNSEHLFNERYKDELQVFHYDGRPTVSEKKSSCFQCGQSLSNGFLTLGSNCNYCNYSGEWYCNDHTAQQRVQIPYKAKEQFDLRGYNVSKTGYERIRSYFQKPIIQIGYDDAVVKRNKKLYDFLVVRRQVHLMYDSICNTELMDKMLKGRLNYCLRINLFSLKNLYDIYNGHEGKHLEGEAAILAKHFYRCETCQARKGRLCALCNHPPKIFAFELRETYSCARCQKISHRRCLIGNKCPCEQ